MPPKKTTKNSQSTGELQPTTAASVADQTDGPATTAVVEVDRVRMKTRQSADSKTVSPSANISAGNTNTTNINNSGDNNDDNYDKMFNEVQQLRSTVLQQQETIVRLASRIDYLLSYLGIDDPKLPNMAQSTTTPCLTDVAPNNINADTSPSTDRITNINIPNGKSLKQKSSDKTFANTVVTAVYNDQYEKRRRANSVIVTGLTPVPGVADQQTIHQLCNDELGIIPDIKSTKRLGQSTNSKSQPLLVILSTSDQASQIVSRAKLLRQSANETIRHQVYINSNLTKAEARAAFEQRCRRREMINKHSDGNNNNNGTRIVVSNSGSLSSIAISQQTTSTTINSNLDPSAPVYQQPM